MQIIKIVIHILILKYDIIESANLVNDFETSFIDNSRKPDANNSIGNSVDFNSSFRNLTYLIKLGRRLALYIRILHSFTIFCFHIALFTYLYKHIHNFHDPRIATLTLRSCIPLHCTIYSILYNILFYLKDLLLVILLQ